MMILSQYHIFELDTINIYSVGPGKQRGTLGLVWRKRKKIRQTINDYLY